MSHFVFHSSSNRFAPSLQKLRLTIGLATCLYALNVDLFQTGYSPLYPQVLLLQAPLGLHTLWQVFTASLILPYQGLSLSMLFDLGCISFFVTPPFAFVHSYLSNTHFFRFLGRIAAVGVIVFYSLAYFFPSYAQDTSLLSGIIFATIIFWSLLHYKGQKSLFLVFPIARFWVVAGTALAVFALPTLEHDWIKVSQLICMGLTAYIYGITACQLRSHVESLEPFENFLNYLYREACRIGQWYILRPLRICKSLFTKKKE